LLILQLYVALFSKIYTRMRAHIHTHVIHSPLACKCKLNGVPACTESIDDGITIITLAISFTSSSGDAEY